MNNKMQICRGGCLPSETLTSMKRIIAASIMFFILVITAYSATYYVDGNLTADCDGTNYRYDVATRTRLAGPGQIAWRSLKSANSALAPGDTVYLREGTFYPTDRTNCIHPARSGTSGSRITYANYNGERVTIDGTNSNFEAILFSPGWNTGNPSDGRSYITVRGINFAYWNKLADLYYASYNEIVNCNFSGHKGDGMEVSYISFEMSHESKHNWIHGNTWHNFGHYVSKDQGCLLDIGFDGSGDAVNSCNNYNTVEDNHFYAGGHHVIGVNNAKFNVIRNNYFHNEGWSTTGDCSKWTTGVCGYRVMSMTDMSGLDVAGSNLLEDNNIAYGAQYGGPHLVDGASGSGLTLDTDKNIVRYNNFFSNVLFGIRTGSSLRPGSTSINNRIYNNTIYYSGYNLDSWGVVNEDDTKLQAWGDPLRCAISLYMDSCDGSTEGNVIKNNLAHDIWSETNILSSSYIYYPAFYVAGAGACNTIANNWGNSGDKQSSPFTPYPDPKFVDPDISNPMALTLVNGKWTGKPNLSLQADSPVIDKATYLTQANGVGSNSKTLTVDDALYFQDGTWGSNLARATFQADSIAIGTVSNTVQISSINYDTNTITLASPKTWSNDAPVWLYKNSSGQVVFRGSAPDIGAHEYVPSVVQAISLSPGWNWISFNVLPGDLSLNSVFNGILLQVEQVKTQTQSAIRSSNTWKGDLADMSGIGQNKMYKVKVSTACTLTVTGTTIAQTTPIPLQTGWNWVAYLPTTAMPIGTALASISGQVQEVKSLTQSATYSGTTWSGNLTQLEPGQGYAIKMSAPGTLIYPAAAATQLNQQKKIQ
jgi:hypothetical protein